MNVEQRKAAIAAYKKRKVSGGVYVVRCAASGEAWVGQWPNLESIQTRLWFSLRQGSARKPDLLAAWRQFGEAQFSFEVLETIDPEETSYLNDKILNERAAYWRSQLGASAI